MLGPTFAGTLALMGWMSVTPPQFQPGERIGAFRHTRYWVAMESDPAYNGLAKTATLRDMEDRVLARVAPEFKVNADLEGTAKLTDGRMLNYAGTRSGQPRYLVTKNPWGDAFFERCPLRVYGTIAVDPDQIPIGSVVQIDETVNLRLADGTLHNGLWRADDTGGAILHDRIDLFVGVKKNQKILDDARLGNLRALTVRMVHRPGATDCRRD